MQARITSNKWIKMPFVGLKSNSLYAKQFFIVSLKI